MSQVQLTALPHIPIIAAGDDLIAVTLAGLSAAGLELRTGDVIVLTSKIVAKAEGRVRRLSQIHPSPAAQEIARYAHKDPRVVELVLAESRQVLRIRPGVLIVEHRLGFVCANAGIDHSNLGADPDQVLLLPADPDASARRIRAALIDQSGVEVAVVINDSHGRAWRLGTVGSAIGIAGLAPLTDRRGQHDLFGNTLEITVLGTADELAAAASLLQGGAAERSPIVHIRGAAYVAGDGRLQDILRPQHEDMFR
ncbi:MAG: coenzyme F420-0:L-glutamate ligase [Caldilineales bacterium]|nr:coenzyme F420-0:L-glutamate ligase [Caldilineales bacterium]